MPPTDRKRNRHAYTPYQEGKPAAWPFQGRTPDSDGGPAATPSLPAKGVHCDSSPQVTYWQQNREDALSW
ncbi:hypothetical protein [Streptomyces sp. IBSBF 2390]|uniref:hypothetical protein n=1 Tax=Streptomyces sp. IBSBF 2390 TaxID=2903533 RepID=UPI002FDC581A